MSEGRPMMRELLEKANAANPQFRPIWGFQPAFEADVNMLNIVTADTLTADEFDLIYSNEEVDVYIIQTLVKGNKSSRLMMFDVKLIGDLRGYEAWLVVQGLIVITRLSQLETHLKHGKRMLLKAMQDIWGVEFQKKGA